MKVYVVCADGGIVYSELPRKEIEAIIDEKGFEFFEDDVNFDHIPSITETELADECSPSYDDDDTEEGELINSYFQIGQAVLLDC